MENKYSEYMWQGGTAPQARKKHEYIKALKFMEDYQLEEVKAELKFKY